MPAVPEPPAPEVVVELTLEAEAPAPAGEVPPLPPQATMKASPTRQHG